MLKFKQAPEHSKSSEREGALLRIEFSDGLVGYADCHPWSELGDLPLKQQLQLLSRGSTTPITKRSLAFAAIDAEARAKQINLFDGLETPLNHLLLTNPRNVEGALEKGFKHIKLKIGKQVIDELKTLESIAQPFKKGEVYFRLDFNGRCRHFFNQEILKKIQSLRPYLDFIEDPCPFHEEVWRLGQQLTQIAWACDRDFAQACNKPQTAKVLVFKPALHNPQLIENIPPEQRVVVTSYLDHPLGQLAAAYTISKMKRRTEICGLLSHTVYRPTPFSESLCIEGSRLKGAPGKGFGFDELLATQNWTRL